MAASGLDGESQSNIPPAASQKRVLLPPATPAYVLRGHAAPIHALNFFAQNARLVSGDADGWVVIWSMVTKRPVAVWKAHEGAILEAKGFHYEKSGETEIFTHGRDHHLRVWKLTVRDEELLDKTLPVDLKQGSQPEAGIKPWLLHSLAVNALNFCAFALCSFPGPQKKDDTDAQLPGKTDDTEEEEEEGDKEPEPFPQNTSRAPLLIAVPNALNSGNIDIFHLPSEHRVSTITVHAAEETGMVMAVNLYFAANQDLYVISAYEDAQAMVHVRRGPLSPQDHDGSIPSTPWTWQKLYAGRAHTQPILSLDVSPAQDYFITSAADPVIVKHPIPTEPSEHSTGFEEMPIKAVNTRFAGKQGLRIRSDGRIFATAGWDARVRVYASHNMKEMACLKWHKEGCFVIAWAQIYTDTPFIMPPAKDLMGRLIPRKENEKDKGPQGSSTAATQDPSSKRSLSAVQLQRMQKAQLTHWLAAGAKDGKISLWDIY